MNAEQIEYLKKLVASLAEWQLCMSYNDSYFGEPAGLVKRTSRELTKLIESFERTTAPVSLTDAQIDDMAFGYAPSGAIGELREFARALLAAAPAPIQQEPVAFIVRLKDNPHKVLCWPDMGPRKRQSANLEYTPLYATPPALAGSQVQAAGDALDAARYRWLREKRDILWKNNIPWCVHLIREHSIPTSVAIHGIALDAAIDTAMREQP